MGKKVNPNLFRIVINKQWKSQWIAKNPRVEARWLAEEDKIRKYIRSKWKEARISKILIMRRDDKLIIITIHCVEVGLIRGQDNKNLVGIEKQVRTITHYKNIQIRINPVTHPALDAQLISEEIANKIENRENYKRAQKFAIRTALALGAKGIKTRVSGRLGGHDMARTEGYTEGIVPRQTLKELVHYGFSQAMTKYGLIGVKVWVCLDPNAKPIQQRGQYRRNR